MTTRQTIAHLKPLRTNVSMAYQHVLDKLATGALPDACQGRVTKWRQAVKDYLTELQRMEVDTKQIKRTGKKLRADLEHYSMDAPDSGVDAWRADKQFAQTLAEYEVLADLHAGHAATRQWLLAMDKRLQQTIHRTHRIHMAAVESRAQVSA